MPMDAELVFICQLGRGHSIIQRMRVRLAKLRNQAREKNRVVRPFKMFVLGIEAISETEEKVTLKKAASAATVFSDSLEKAIEEYPGIIGGAQVNVGK